MQSASYAYDVFLSHSSKDKAIVKAIAEQLQGAGLRVWYDEWELLPGDSIPSKIDDGLENSRVLVLCMSSNSLGSEWAQMESQTFRFRDPQNKGRRFIPLRLDSSPAKGSIEQLLHIDWTSDNKEQAFDRLVKACQSQPQTRDQRPNNAGTEPAKVVHPSDYSHSSCSDFFDTRFSRAFPGEQKKVIWFNEIDQIAKRLGRLLESPLRYRNYTPIWWFRGGMNNSVESFRKLDATKLLLNELELEIDRIAAVHFEGYWNSFVYVEVKASEPTGVYGTNYKPDILSGVNWEEVCLYRDNYYSKGCYDDSAAVIDGEPVDFNGEEELRRRYTSRSNFLLAAHDASINNSNLDSFLGNLLDQILVDPSKFDQLVSLVEKLPKRVKYFEQD